MPCLTWWCAEPAWWPGMKLGSDAAESAKYRIASASSRRPAMTAGMIRAGRLVTAGLSGEGEDGEAEGAGQCAVDGERGEAVGFEVAHEEANGEIRGDRRGQRAAEGR